MRAIWRTFLLGTALLIDILVFTGLILIGYAVFDAFGLPAALGYFGALCLLIAGALVMRKESNEPH